MMSINRVKRRNKKFVFFLVFAVVLIVGLFAYTYSLKAPISSGPSALRTEGSKIVDESGRFVILRGGGFDYYKGEVDTGASVYDTLSRLKSKGMNAARLAFAVPDFGSGSITDLDYGKLDPVLDWMTENGMYAVLDCHIPSDLVTFKKAWISTVVDLVSHTKGRPNVLYQIANEPSGGREEIAAMRSAMLECIAAIREVDTKRIIIAPAAYGGGFDSLNETWRPEDITPNTAYHAWAWTQPRGRIEDAEDDYPEAKAYAYKVVSAYLGFMRSRNAPVINMEFGTKDSFIKNFNYTAEAYKNRILIELLDEQGIGHFHWLVYPRGLEYPRWDYYYPTPYTTQYYDPSLIPRFPPYTIEDYAISYSGTDTSNLPLGVALRHKGDYITLKPGITIKVKLWRGEPYYGGELLTERFLALNLETEISYQNYFNQSEGFVLEIYLYEVTYIEG